MVKKVNVILFGVIIGVVALVGVVAAYSWALSSYGPLWVMWGPQYSGDRLSMDDVERILEDYTANLGPRFGVLEIMEFTNNFYAVIYERDTGVGAFEVLVNPYSGAVALEPGPNMMWNTKYGMHGTGRGAVEDMAISREKAAGIAVSYLSKRYAETVDVEEPIMFYGYYTVDYMINGRMQGMLSVNGYTGEVWVHTWHGGFVQEKEMEEHAE